MDNMCTYLGAGGSLPHTVPGLIKGLDNVIIQVWPGFACFATSLSSLKLAVKKGPGCIITNQV